jgi:ketosteroid isomerase-like protein
MPARSPEETSSLFTDAINSSDLDAVIALYEPDATSLPPTGEAAVSTNDARRAMFSGMMALNPTIALHVTRTLESGDVAMVTGSWTLEGKDPDGNAVMMDGHYADVVRRQSDGSWLFVIDNPLPAS